MLTPPSDLGELKSQMEAVIRSQSEGFFEAPEDLATLRVTIRIACEFLDFLNKSDNFPDLNDAAYMAGTIRSGMDEYFRLAQWGRIITGVNLRSGFRTDLPTTFSQMKSSYVSTLAQLTQSDSIAKAVSMLLCLTQVMLLFMAIYFPSA